MNPPSLRLRLSHNAATNQVNERRLARSKLHGAPDAPQCLEEAVQQL